MTIIPIFPISANYGAKPYDQAATREVKAREEQTFYEDHSGLEFPAWIRGAVNVLSAVLAGRRRTRASRPHRASLLSASTPRS
jgi:hypothetical protein